MSQVRTEKYEFIHGKKPKGIAIWSFKVQNESAEYHVEGYYSDAKKEAIKHFGKDKTIEVLS